MTHLRTIHHKGKMQFEYGEVDFPAWISLRFADDNRVIGADVRLDDGAYLELIWDLVDEADTYHATEKAEWEDQLKSLSDALESATAELEEVTAERDRLQSDLDMAEWDGPL